MIKIAPSILSSNFSKLGEEVLKVQEAGIDMLHIDVMDGMFVPNISFGTPIIKSIRPLVNSIFDVHLMIMDPLRFIEDFSNAGADIITFHYEADRHIDRTISCIKNCGKKASIALNPATPISVLENVIGSLDMVLIMTVNPGFGGQKYIPYCSDKIKALRAMALEKNPDLHIQVDGGIDEITIKKVVESGADTIVAGSAIFNSRGIKNNVDMLREAIK